MAKLFAHRSENEQPVKKGTLFLWYFIAFMVIIPQKSVISSYFFMLNPSGYQTFCLIFDIILLLVVIVHTLYLTVKYIIQRLKERKMEK